MFEYRCTKDTNHQIFNINRVNRVNRVKQIDNKGLLKINLINTLNLKHLYTTASKLFQQLEALLQTAINRVNYVISRRELLRKMCSHVD